MKYSHGNLIGGKFTKGSVPTWDWTVRGGDYDQGLDFFTVHWEVQERDTANVRLHVEAPRQSTDSFLNSIKQQLVEAILKSRIAVVVRQAGFAYECGTKVSVAAIRRNKSTEAFRVALTGGQRKPTSEGNIEVVHEAIGSHVGQVLEQFRESLDQYFCRNPQPVAPSLYLNGMARTSDRLSGSTRAASSPHSVLEALMHEYAKLIADTAVSKRPRLAPAARSGKAYWSFTTMTRKKLLAGHISPSAILRENKLLVNSPLECAYCGATGAFQWDHIIPLSRGGPDTMDNLVLSCSPCNGQKSSQNLIDWYRKRGLGREHIPRLVMGKLLKLVLEEHRRRGTLLATEFPMGQGLRVANLCRVFEYPEHASSKTE